jgi:plasmid stabilization system protein ParE
MTYKLNVSKDAHLDVDGIIEYMIVNLNNTAAAISFLDDVEKSYRNISENPFMYSYCNDDRLRHQGYRKIPIKNYLILYSADEKARTVNIMRVFFGGRNYPELV